MGLHILYSDQIESLVSDLKARLKAERTAGDPFRRLIVTVPNPNLAKYLQLKVFSKESGLCAGIEFPFMEQRLTHLLVENFANQDEFKLLPDHSYAMAIAGMLVAGDDAFEGSAALAPFRAYILEEAGEGRAFIRTRHQARKVWQLAEKLAALMDQYEVRRPEIVWNWMSGKNAAGTGRCVRGSIEAGEAALARRLWGEGGIFPTSGNQLSLRQLFERVEKARPTGEKQTIFFFGHSTLSILQVKILVWLAQVHEVYFYHNNVCLEYWGDIETKAERIRKLGKTAIGEQEDLAIENSLLSEWGRAGRETLRLFVELEEENDGRIDFEWREVAAKVPRLGTSVLGRIQESICHRTSEVGRVAQDASLQIVGVPSIRREIEMVYNSILGSVWKPKGSGTRPWGDCSFSDIAVLVPDLATYRSVIEAVFDGRGQIPYGLIDTTASEVSLFLAGFLALIDIARTGLTRATLFEVLENPCVQRALKFSVEDVNQWREMTERMGAFDGFERKEGDASYFNWSWGLERLRLASVARDLKVAERAAELPLVAADEESALKFSEAVEVIYQSVFALGGEERNVGRLLPCAEWTKLLMRLMADCLDVSEAEDPMEANVREQVVMTLFGLDRIEGAQSLEFVVAAVENFVGGLACRKGGYLTHGVTMAGMMPMRPVPFKQVYIVGLGAAGFPRREQDSTLDIRGAAWHLGDVSTPQIKKYLFLETLMAVRERLVISYSNRDLEKDEELYPSGLVRELEDFASAAILKEPFKEVLDYPLLERGEVGGVGDEGILADIRWKKGDAFAGILPTYSETARRMAHERVGGESAAQSAAGCAVAERIIEFTAAKLGKFLESPMRAILQQHFGIAEEKYQDANLEDDAPLEIEFGPEKWDLQKAWLEGEDVGEELEKLTMQGKLPGGFIGDFSKLQFLKTLENAKVLRSFISEFESMGEKEIKQANWMCEVVRGKEFVKVRVSAPAKEWIVNGGRLSVLTTGKVAEYPSGRVLKELMAFLIETANGTGVEGHELRVGLVDVESAEKDVWKWVVSAQEAREYLTRLVTRMVQFLDAPRDGKYLDFEYRKLGAAITNKKIGLNWTKVVEEIKQVNAVFKGNSYERHLAVEETIKRYCRVPTEKEIEEIYYALYELPLRGEKEGVNE